MRKNARLWLAIASFSIGLICWGCTMASSPVVPEVAADETLERAARPIVSGGQQLPIEAQVAIGDRIIYLEVARTAEQQRIGLMNRESLGPQCGMVFPFEPPRPVRFWMKNVAISLDMIFMREGTIRAIEASVPPCDGDPCPLYGPPREPIDRVIELAGGRAAELGLVVGDRLEIQPLAANAPEPPCP